MTRKRYKGRFIKLDHLLLKHPAFQDLSGDAVKLLLYVWQRFNGSNNGQISFSVREAAILLHRSKDTALRRFNELVDHGFLDIGTKGAFRIKTRHATEWRITMEYANEQLATHDYAHWKLGVKALDAASNARQELAQKRTGEKQNTVTLRRTDGPNGKDRTVRQY